MVLAVFWLSFAFAAIMPMRWSIYLFFAILPFGALSVIPTEITGGTTILPVIVCSALMVTKVFSDHRHRMTLVDGLLGLKRLGLLTGFVLVALIVTATAPRLFSGTPIMGLNTLTITPLAFGAGNLTQSIYLSSSFLITASLYSLLLNPDDRLVVARAVLVGGTVVVASGLADMATAGTAILEPVRTATYSLLTNDSIGTMRRVVGFDTEASSYGTLSLAFASILYFIRPANLLGPSARFLQHLLAAACFVTTILSTSSAAYVGLATFIFCAIADVVRRAIVQREPESGRALVWDVLVLAALGVAIVTVLLLDPVIRSAIYGTVDTIVLKKGESASYLERSTWNSVSLDGLLETSGFGLGVGSTRTSNWVLAVLTGTGLLGAGLLLAFILLALFASVPRGDPVLRGMCLGSRIALIILAVPALGAGTVVDFGPFNALIFGSLAALRVAIAPAPWMRARRPHGIRLPRDAAALHA